MSFNSLEFLVFFAVFAAIWPWVRRHNRVRTIAIVSGSFVFYAWWDPRFLPLLVFSGLIDYGAALAIERWTAWRRTWLWISIGANLATLFFFKYAAWFSGQLTGVLGMETPAGWLADVILPLGISFYTFQSMSYTIDVYRRDIRAERDVLLFFAFLTMFPQLVAGPIARAHALLPQVETHGTGTALGDPTEAGGLERALGATAPILGSLKANLGHAEPSAALASILMVRMALHQLAAVGNGNAQLRVCNVMVDPALRGMRAQLPTQRLAASARARHVGVSSFGYSGTIAHVVLLCDATAWLGKRHCTQPPCLRFRRRAFPWWPEAAPPSAPTERPAAVRTTLPFARATCGLLGASPPPLADHLPSVPAPLPPPTTTSPLVEQLALQAEASAELSLLALGALDTRGRERGRDLGTLVRNDCLLMTSDDL